MCKEVWVTPVRKTFCLRDWRERNSLGMILKSRVDVSEIFLTIKYKYGQTLSNTEKHVYKHNSFAWHLFPWDTQPRLKHRGYEWFHELCLTWHLRIHTQIMYFITLLLDEFTVSLPFSELLYKNVKSRSKDSIIIQINVLPIHNRIDL